MTLLQASLVPRLLDLFQHTREKRLGSLGMRLVASYNVYL